MFCKNILYKRIAISTQKMLNPDDFKNPHIKDFISTLSPNACFYFDKEVKLTKENIISIGEISDFRAEFINKTKNDNSQLLYTNYLFYANRLSADMIFHKRNHSIDEVHTLIQRGIYDSKEEYLEDYLWMEKGHSFIQRLFPLHEGCGLNSTKLISALGIDEAELMMNNPAIMRRFYKSYKLLMKYYGFDVDDYTFKLKYTRDSRYNDTSKHNSLRISRILKSLDYLGLSHLVVPTILGFFNRGMDKTLQENSQYVDTIIILGCEFVRNESDRAELITVANYILTNNIE